MCGQQTDPQTEFLRSLDEGAPVLSLVEAVVQSGSACNEHIQVPSVSHIIPSHSWQKLKKQQLFNASEKSYIKPRALRTTLEQIQMPEAILVSKSGQQNSFVSGCFMMFSTSSF